MSTTTANTQNNFNGVHVSKGFVRGLQGQVLKLEQNQQSLIQQLEHANNLASEYHASAVAWQQKYDAALGEMEEMRLTFQAERDQWNQSISPDHPHDYSGESMSPVSIPSSSPRKPPAAISAHDREYIKHQLLIDQDPTPFDENDERIVVRDGKMFKQWMQCGFGNVPCYGEREMTTSECEDYDDESAGDGEDEYYEDQDQDQEQDQEYYEDESGSDEQCVETN
jgi:hypothetical protein